MTPTEQLLACYQQQLDNAAARMDSSLASTDAYRNAQADWVEARDVIVQLRQAHLSHEEIEAAHL